MLGSVLKSRIWNRIYVAFCDGSIPDSCLKGFMQTKQFEIYGPTLNILPTLGRTLATSSSSPPPMDCVRLRTRFTESTIIHLAEGLKTSTTLKKLYLTCAFSDEASVHLLSAALAFNQHLELLSLYSCELPNEESMEKVLMVLQNHPSLVTLELRDNNTTGAAALSSLIQHTQTIENLDLYFPPQILPARQQGHHHNQHQQQVPRFHTESFCIGLRENKSLKSLSLANNALQTPDILYLSQALRSNRTLQRLNLQGNLVQDDGIEALANVLPEMTLKELW
jgi:Ran GTPase-activating protein (RanGAP) involved in mRNA processing and transport